MDFDWLPNTSKRMANPGPNFFSQPTIAGDNIEVPGTFSNSSNPVSGYIEAALARRESIEEFGKIIAPLNARYVVVFETADLFNYGFLFDQEDLEPIFEGLSITVFRNSSPTPLAYSVNGLTFLRGVGDYLDSPSSLRPFQSLYVMGAGDNNNSIGASGGAAEAGHPENVKSGNLSYEVQDPKGKYVVVTLSQQTTRRGWEWDGANPEPMNLGMMPAFEVVEGASSLTFARFYKLYLPTYILAIAALAVASILYKSHE